MKLLKYLMRLPVLIAAYIGLVFIFFISNYGIYRLILKLQEQYSYKWLGEMLHYVTLVLDHFWIGAVIGLLLLIVGWFFLFNLGIFTNNNSTLQSDNTQGENSGVENEK